VGYYVEEVRLLNLQADCRVVHNPASVAVNDDEDHHSHPTDITALFDFEMAMVEGLELYLVLACQGNRSEAGAEPIDLRDAREDQGAYSPAYLWEAVLEEPTVEVVAVSEVSFVAQEVVDYWAIVLEFQNGNSLREDTFADSDAMLNFFLRSVNHYGHLGSLKSHC
jgi:hypothetical protein